MNKFYSVQTAFGYGFFDLPDGLGHLDIPRTGIRAVKNRMTAVYPKLLIEDLQTLGCSLVPAVKDETMSSYKGGRTEIVITGPEGWAGSGAGRTQDALGGIVKPLPIFRAL